MHIKPADRLAHFSEYYFSTKLREIRELEAQGRPIISLGIGSPDLSPEPTVIEELQKVAEERGVHGYQPYQGLPELIAAVKGFYQSRFGLEWKEASVLPLMGSKEGITHISLAYLNPGDQVLIPSLGYPTYSSVTKMVGAEPVYFPLLEENDWKPDWEYLENLDTFKIKLMWLNYPHMPTGTLASEDELARYVSFAKERNILIGYDNPYSFILNSKPISIFNVEGAREVAVELNSLSKTFNMAGWRIGWVMGSPNLIKPILQIKSNMDSGMFKPLQLAAAKALNLSDDWFYSLDHIYTIRKEITYKILDALGCTYKKGQSGMFVWARVPSGDGEKMVQYLLDKYNVFVAPGFIFGEAGRQFIRLSLCVSSEKLTEVYHRIASSAF